MGFNGQNNIDIDKLTHMLEENRELLNDMTSRECSREGAAQLPKMLFDLVNQTSEQQADGSETAPAGNDPKITSAKDIIHNFPKVWKVLIELLNHQNDIQVELRVSL